MFLAADIHIHGQIRVDPVRRKRGLRVVRVQEAEIVPGGVDKRVHGVRLPLCRTPAAAGEGVGEGQMMMRKWQREKGKQVLAGKIC